MSFKKRNIVPYLLLMPALGAALYFGLKSNSLSKKLQNLKSTENQPSLSERDKKVLSGDSLLLSKDYEEALRIYKNIQPSPGSDFKTDFRVKITTNLLAIENELEKTRELLPNIKDSLAIRQDLVKRDLERIDSLNFALKKAQLQLASAKRQMLEKSFGEYLTFKSQKGNRLFYVGEVKNKKANGFGIAILDTGSRYEGNWKDNMRHGEGNFYWIDGEHYEGSFKNDQRTGQGTYYWPNGEKYVGGWKNDLRHGEGKFYDKNGNVVTEGIWKEDKLVESK